MSDSYGDVAMVRCRHCVEPIAATRLGWRHSTGLVGCFFDDGFLPTVAAPAPQRMVEALARDDVLLDSYLDKHHLVRTPYATLPKNVARTS